jgi:hypothetical protein
MARAIAILSRRRRAFAARNDGVLWSGAGRLAGFSFDCLPPGSRNVMPSDHRTVSSAFARRSRSRTLVQHPSTMCWQLSITSPTPGCK